ncbi:zinc finger protein 273-like [Dendronephthya gigantea]|uniref:zinc finger protein 273-like n=1 Tax=Dendronephthya gigantea TaxID=151771 RepID=UPI00106DC34D|nr:zinc finger protein 273-like [Dendronephthya gigantea]
MPRSFLIRKILAISDDEEDIPDARPEECVEKTKPRSDELLPVLHREVSNVPEEQSRDKTSGSSFQTVETNAELSLISSCTFHCELCTRSFNRASDLKRHQLAHIESKPYRCHVCDRQFTWLGNFHKHCATHEQSAPHLPLFPQPSLFTVYPTPPTLFNATPYSHPSSPGFYFSGFPRRSEVSPFGGFNQVPRVLQCNICLLTFTTSRALKMHTRIHSGEKPYKCGQCNKAFARKDELHTHKYFHTVF